MLQHHAALDNVRLFLFGVNVNVLMHVLIVELADADPTDPPPARAPAAEAPLGPELHSFIRGLSIKAQEESLPEHP